MVLPQTERISNSKDFQPTMSTSPFAVRPATLASSDDGHLINFKDSQIEWLSTVGSIDQWGTKPSRESNPSVLSRCRSWVERSEQQGEWSIDWCRAFIAETPSGTPVAGLVLEAKSPAVTRSILPEQDENDPFIYLAYLISNRQASGEEKGAGSALIAFAKEQARSAGVKRLCLDCWAGNDRKLVR